MIENAYETADDIELFPLEQLDLACEATRMAEVIGVHSGDEITLCLGDSAVHGGGDTRVNLGDETEARIVDGCGFGGPIGGTVVDHDQLNIGIPVAD